MKWLLIAIAALTIAGCNRTALPEQNSYAAQLYVQRCGGCHVAYNPHTMTAPMWEVQVKAGEERMRQGGMMPLTPEQRKTIIDYLQRNAGQQ